MYLSIPKSPSLVVAEPSKSYQTEAIKWVEVLVDCPGVQELYTYRLPEDLSVKSGDLVTVPFGSQIVGGIVIRLVPTPPPDLALEKIKEVEDVGACGFFPENYWQLLCRVAEYYCADLMTVIRIALPPGLLGRSQRRLRLQSVPQGAETFLSETAKQVLRLLQSQKSGDYSTQYIYRQIRGANRGIRELSKRGWVESYLEPPKIARPKQQKAVTLVIDSLSPDLTEKQREILEILRFQGGELWLTDLLRIARASTSTVETLYIKGCVVIEQRERLRFLKELHPEREIAKQLTPSQREALNLIASLDHFSQVLLHGVTGSGKTEVYLQAIAPILEQGKSALVLVPEIGLTPQLTDRFRARFGDKIYVYHSELSEGERYDTWRQMLTGEPQIVIGTRSAIFAPLPQLGLIILDEEHDSSFKQQHLTPTYHTRRVALWRAQLANCPLLLGSATPSIEAWVDAKKLTNNPVCVIKTHYLTLPERIQSRPLPPIEIVDLRQELQSGNRSIFSRSLAQALEQIQQKGRQGILFVSRRGHSTFVSCRSCGYVIECPNCDVSLSYHYGGEGAAELLRCHYCNYGSLHPRKCPECASPYLKFFGTGTQKVAEELARQFPQIRFIRFDSDTTGKKGEHRRLLTSFAQGEADVLIGTQMITKGLDLAQVTLVGVVAADGLLHHSDYRASERAFQTLTQVAGRAGRGEEPGRVIIQTYSPEHPVIQAVKNHDYHSFIAAELQQRAQLNYPPLGNLILIQLSGMDERQVRETAELLGKKCQEIVGELGEILGPAPANIMRLVNRYRWQILLKFLPRDGGELPELKKLRSICPQGVTMLIDVDPISIE